MSAFIGTNGLISTLKQITAFPATLICMFNQSSTNATAAVPANQTTVGADRGIRIILENNGSTVYANHRNLGGSSNGSAITFLPRSSGTWYAMRARFNSVSDRDVVIGALSTFASDATTVSNDLAAHDTFQIGNSLNGMIAEVGVFSGTAVSDAEYNAYKAGTLLVENMTGVTLAAALLTIPDGATTLSAETGQTLTISGTVTQGSSHPNIRTAPDSTAPTFTGAMTSSGVTNTAYTISWAGCTRTDNVAITGFETSADNSTWTDAGNVTSKSYTGKSASTTYQNYVRAYDAAGNKSSSLSLPVTTAAAADTTAPNLSGSITQGTITSTSSAITYPAATDNIAVDHYEVSKDGTTWINNALNLGYSFTGLTPSTAYTQRVRALDAAGNVSSVLSLAVTTSAAPSAPLVTLPGFLARFPGGMPLVNEAGKFQFLSKTDLTASPLANVAKTTSSTGTVAPWTQVGLTAGVKIRGRWISDADGFEAQFDITPT